MKIDKVYLYTEFGNFFFVATLIFLFLFMIRPFLWFTDMIINHFFTIVTVLKFFLLSLLESSPDIVVLSFLTAISGTVARMNMENEYWIFLISGISARQIFRHFVFFAAIFVIIEFWLCFFVSPSASYSRKLLLAQARMNEPMKIFKSRSLIRDFPGIKIYINRLNGIKLADISITYREGSDSVCRIQAKTGNIATDKKGYVYLMLKKGHIETYSIKKNDLIYRISFDAYSFSLPYRRAINFPPDRRIKEMTLPLLLDKLDSASMNEARDVMLVFLKKIFFTFLPFFYLFFGFYVGIGIKATGYFQILGTGLTIGLVSYFIILFGEGIAYKSNNVFTFLIVPAIFMFVVIMIKRYFAHVT